VPYNPSFPHVSGSIFPFDIIFSGTTIGLTYNIRLSVRVRVQEVLLSDTISTTAMIRQQAGILSSTTNLNRNGTAVQEGEGR